VNDLRVLLQKGNPLVTSLATPVGQSMAIPTSEIVSIRWKIEFTHTPITEIHLRPERTSEPPTYSAKIRVCGLEGNLLFHVPFSLSEIQSEEKMQDWSIKPIGPHNKMDRSNELARS